MALDGSNQNPGILGGNSRFENTRSTRSSVFGYVSRAEDGDTFYYYSGNSGLRDVRVPSNYLRGRTTTVRLMGVDTPEVVDPRKPVQFFGPEASAFTKSVLVSGTRIRVEFDSSLAKTTDEYDRQLGYVYYTDPADGKEKMLQEELVRRGYAREYTFRGQSYQEQENFKALEREAQKNKSGMWAYKGTPSIFSQQLLNFMPERNWGMMPTRYWADPSSLADSREWALTHLRRKAIYSLDQKNYWNGFSGLLDKPYKESLDDFLSSFENTQGFMENLARQLNYYYGNDFNQPLPQNVYNAVRAYDLGAQYRTIGQSDWWSASGFSSLVAAGYYLKRQAYGNFEINVLGDENNRLLNRVATVRGNAAARTARSFLTSPYGHAVVAGLTTFIALKGLEVLSSGDIYVQASNRGPIATIAKRVGQDFDQSQADFYGISEEGPKAGVLENIATSTVNFGESFAQNMAGYYFISRPFMVISSRFFSNYGSYLTQNIAERRLEAGNNQGRFFSTGFMERTLAAYNATDRFLRHTYARFLDSFARPFVEFFGGDSWVKFIDSYTREFYSSEKRFGDLRVNFIQDVDERFAGSPLTKAISTQGIGGFFNAFSPDVLFRFANRGYLALEGLTRDIRAKRTHGAFVDQFRREFQEAFPESEDISADGREELAERRQRIRGYVLSGQLNGFLDSERSAAFIQQQEATARTVSQLERELESLKIQRMNLSAMLADTPFEGSTEALDQQIARIQNNIDAARTALNDSADKLARQVGTSNKAFFQFNYHWEQLKADIRGTWAQMLGIKPGQNTHVTGIKGLFTTGGMAVAGLALAGDLMLGYMSSAPRVSVFTQLFATQAVNNYATKLSGYSSAFNPFTFNTIFGRQGSLGRLFNFYTPGFTRYDEELQSIAASPFELYNNFSGSKFAGNLAVATAIGLSAGATGALRYAESMSAASLLSAARTRAIVGFGLGFAGAKGIAGVVGLAAAAAQYMFVETPVAAVLNALNTVAASDFNNQIAGQGAFAISKINAAGTVIESKLRFRDSRRFAVQSEYANYYGDVDKANKLAMMAMFGPTENQMDATGRQAYGKAAQISLHPLLFTFTASENTIGAETRLALTFQGPAIFQIGLNLESPFKFSRLSAAKAAYLQARGTKPSEESFGSRLFAGLTSGTLVAGLGFVAGSILKSDRVAGIGLATAALTAGIASATGLRPTRDFLNFLPGVEPVSSAILGESEVKFDPDASGSKWLFAAITGAGLQAGHFAIRHISNRFLNVFDPTRGIRDSVLGTQVRSVFNLTGSAIRLYNRALNLLPRAVIGLAEEVLVNKPLNWLTARVLRDEFGLSENETDDILRRSSQERRMFGAARHRAILEAVAKQRNIQFNHAQGTGTTGFDYNNSDHIARVEAEIERTNRTSNSIFRFIGFNWLFQTERLGARIEREIDRYERTMSTGDTVARNAVTNYRSGMPSKIYRAGRFVAGSGGLFLLGALLFQGAYAAINGRQGIETVTQNMIYGKSNADRQYSGFGRAMLDAFYSYIGVGAKTHPLEETYITLVDKEMFDAKKNKDVPIKDLGTSIYRIGTMLWEGISSIPYFGSGSPFVGTGVFGGVTSYEGEELVWAKTYFQPTLVPGFNLSYASGVVSLARKTNFNEFVNQLNFQAGSTRDAMAWLSNRVRMRRKPLTVGKLFHEKSAIHSLSSVSQYEIHRRFELTRWISHNNVGLDAAIYFQLDHTRQAGIFKGMQRGTRLNPLSDYFSPEYTTEAFGKSGLAVLTGVFKRDGHLRVIQSLYEALINNRNYAENNAILPELDAENVMGRILDKSSGFSGPQGVNPYFEALSNISNISVFSLAGIAASAAFTLGGLVLAGQSRLRKMGRTYEGNSFYRILAGAIDLVKTPGALQESIARGYGKTGEGLFMTMYGVDASRSGRLLYEGSAGTIFDTRYKGWRDPRNRYWIIGIGQPGGEGGFYHYGVSPEDYRGININQGSTSATSLLVGGRSGGANPFFINLSHFAGFLRESTYLLYSGHNERGLERLFAQEATVVDRSYRILFGVRQFAKHRVNMQTEVQNHLNQLERAKTNLNAEIGNATGQRLATLQRDLNSIENQIESTKHLRAGLERFTADSKLSKWEKTIENITRRIESIWQTILEDESIVGYDAKHRALNENAKAQRLIERLHRVIGGAPSTVRRNPLEGMLNFIRSVHSGEYFRTGIIDVNTGQPMTYQSMQEAFGFHKVEGRFLERIQGGFEYILSGQMTDALVGIGKNSGEGSFIKRLINSWNTDFRVSRMATLIGNSSMNSDLQITVRQRLDNLVQNTTAPGMQSSAAEALITPEMEEIRRLITESGVSPEEAKRLMESVGDHVRSIAARDAGRGAGVLAMVGLYAAKNIFSEFIVPNTGRLLMTSAFAGMVRSYTGVGIGLSAASDQKLDYNDRIYAAKSVIQDLPALYSGALLGATMGATSLIESGVMGLNAYRKAAADLGLQANQTIGNAIRGFVRGILVSPTQENQLVTRLGQAVLAGHPASAYATEEAAQAAYQAEITTLTRQTAQGEVRATASGITRFFRYFGRQILSRQGFEAISILASISPAARIGMLGVLPALAVSGGMLATGADASSSAFGGLAAAGIGLFFAAPQNIVLGIGLAAISFFGYAMLEEHSKRVINNLFANREQQLINYLDRNPVVSFGIRFVTGLAAGTQVFLDETLGRLADNLINNEEKNPLYSGALSGLGKILGGLREIISPVSRTSYSAIFFDPDYVRSFSPSDDPTAWRLPGGQGSAFDMADKTPLWHGNMRDAINRRLSEQERVRRGDPSLLLQEWFHSSMFGQQDSPGESIMRSPLSPHRGSTIWSNFGNLSTFGEATQIILKQRALETQFQMTRLLERWDIWNDWTRSKGVTDSGYAVNLGRKIKTTATMFKVRPGFAQINIAANPERVSRSGRAVLIDEEILQRASRRNFMPPQAADGNRRAEESSGFLSTALTVGGLGLLAYQFRGLFAGEAAAAAAGAAGIGLAEAEAGLSVAAAGGIAEAIAAGGISASAFEMTLLAGLGVGLIAGAVATVGLLGYGAYQLYRHFRPGTQQAPSVVRPSGSPRPSPTPTATSTPGVILRTLPSASPTGISSTRPSIKPSARPSSLVGTPSPHATSVAPSVKPSIRPSLVPKPVSSHAPNVISSTAPSIKPSVRPSLIPPALPSHTPAAIARVAPSVKPSVRPSIIPTPIQSHTPQVVRSTAPSIKPSVRPSLIPQAIPSNTPRVIASVAPSVKPSVRPSLIPSHKPSANFTPTPEPSSSIFPAVTPTPSPTPSLGTALSPSAVPSSSPEIRDNSGNNRSLFSGDQLRNYGTIALIGLGVTALAGLAVYSPVAAAATIGLGLIGFGLYSLFNSGRNSNHENIAPTIKPSIKPSTAPNIIPRALPSSTPLVIASTAPSVKPTVRPSLIPHSTSSSTPKAIASVAPSIKPSIRPSLIPSHNPVNTLTPSPSPLQSFSPRTDRSSLAVRPSVSPSLSPSPAATHSVNTIKNKAESRVGANIAVFANAFSKDTFAYTDEWGNKTLRDLKNLDKGTLIYGAQSLREFPYFLQEAKKAFSTPENKGKKLIISLVGHGGGGQAGILFYESNLKKGGNQLVVEAASYAWIQEKIKKAGFKPEEVEIIMDSCNAATGFYNTKNGFTNQGLNILKSDYVKYIHSKRGFKGEIIFDILEASNKNAQYNYSIFGTQTLDLGVESLERFLSGDLKGSKSPWDNIIEISKLEKKPHFQGDSTEEESSYFTKKMHVDFIKKRLQTFENLIKTNSLTAVKQILGGIYEDTNKKAEDLSSQNKPNGPVNNINQVSDTKNVNPTSLNSYYAGPKTRLLRFMTTQFLYQQALDNQRKIFGKDIYLIKDPKEILAIINNLAKTDTNLKNQNVVISIAGHSGEKFQFHAIDPEKKQIITSTVDAKAYVYYLNQISLDPKKVTILQDSCHALFAFTKSKNRTLRELDEPLPLVRNEKIGKTVEFEYKLPIKTRVLESFTLGAPNWKLEAKLWSRAWVDVGLLPGFDPGPLKMKAYGTDNYTFFRPLYNNLDVTLQFLTGRTALTRADRIQDISAGEFVNEPGNTSENNTGRAFSRYQMKYLNKIGAEIEQQNKRIAIGERRKNQLEARGIIPVPVYEDIPTLQNSPLVQESYQRAQGKPTKPINSKTKLKPFVEGKTEGITAWGYYKLNASYLMNNPLRIISEAYNLILNWLDPSAQAAELTPVRRQKEQVFTAATSAGFGSIFVGWFNSVWNKVKQTAEEVKEKGKNVLQNIGDSIGAFFMPPAEASTIVSGFGPRQNPHNMKTREIKEHHGMDFAVPIGTSIPAAQSGTISFSGWQNGYGYTTIIDVGGGYQVLYGHQSKLLAKVGQTVSRGEIIGLSGNTGASEGPHVHFEVRKNGVAVDPSSLISNKNQKPTQADWRNKLLAEISSENSPAREFTKSISCILQEGNGALPAWDSVPADRKTNIEEAAINNLRKYDPIVQRAAERFKVPANIIRSIMLIESNANADIGTNKYGATGIMQVVGAYHSATAKKLTGSTDLNNAEVNIMTGTAIFADYFRQKSLHGSLMLAISAYNAGPGNVQKYGGVPPFQETRAYIAKLTDYYHMLSKYSGTRETLDMDLMDKFTALYKKDHAYAKNIKIEYIASISADSDRTNHDNHAGNSEIERRTEIRLFRDPATARQVARATYPDGTKWTSAWDRHFSPVEYSGLDNHYGRL